MIKQKITTLESEIKKEKKHNVAKDSKKKEKTPKVKKKKKGCEMRTFHSPEGGGTFSIIELSIIDHRSCRPNLISTGILFLPVAIKGDA